MNICQNCKTEGEKNSKFCKNCGSEIIIETTETDIENKDILTSLKTVLSNEDDTKQKKVKGLFLSIKEKVKKFILFRSKKNIIITIIIAALIVGIGFIWKSNIIPNKIATIIYNDYKVSHRTYENAISKLDFIDKIGDVQWAYEKCEELNNSRCSYKTGYEYLQSGQYVKALIEFAKVIQEDENYNDAAQKIEELIVTVKNDAINKLKEFEASNNFYDALELIEDIEKVMVLDEGIREYKRVFTDAKNAYEEEQRIKKELESCDLTSPYGIHKYIKIKYGVLKGTPLGDWEFDVEVHENDVDYISYDYNITLNVDPSNTNLTDLKYSNKVSYEDRVETDNMLKTHMYNLAMDIISKLPDKKIKGEYWEGYDNSDYVDMFYPWTNYTENYSSNYYSTKPGAFRWEPYYSGSFLD